ncbi:MAG: KR domain-containing protein [Salinarimonas sp.]|nr:KR domain-containing protein [Salinarimonas sp.]
MSAASAPSPLDSITRDLVEILAEVTGLPGEAIDPAEPMERYGISSAMIVELSRALAPRFPHASNNLFFEYRTLDALAGHLAREYPEHAASDAPEAKPVADPASSRATRGTAITQQPAAQTGPPANAASRAAAKEPGDTDQWLEEWLAEGRSHGDAGNAPIAVIGMAGRYPQAPDLATFWDNLRSGRNSVTPVPAQRWDAEAWFDPDPERPDRSYSKWGGFLDRVDLFDNRFFQISPREARRMDPQERLFLETGWQCFEEAGYGPAALAGSSTGVFVGAMWSLYQLYGAERTAAGTPDIASSSFASIANRLSWFLDLRGPSLTVDTMCSSALTALALAIQALRRGECDQALVGGVNICSHPAKYLHLSRGGFAAKDGLCRAFGEGGSGYVPGEGVGAVLLKPLATASADGDEILAVIRGCAVSHGGRTHGYTVPSPQGQNDCIAKALAESRLDPATIAYVEAHGTGTALGDPIEVEGLLRSYGQRDTPLKVGSVKSNIGHLESAAAMAGLHKLILQLQHGELVPSLHAQARNPNIPWERIPLTVQETVTPLSPDETRAMALSAFGAGGSNAHLILTGAPHRRPRPAAKGSSDETARPFWISAANDAALHAHCVRLKDWLATAGRRHDFADIAATLLLRRDPLPARLAFTAQSHDVAVARLNDWLNGTPLPSASDTPDDLAARWQAGETIDPEQVWPDAPIRKVPVPARPLQPTPHWLALPLGPQGVSGPAQDTPRDEAPSSPAVAMLRAEWIAHEEADASSTSNAAPRPPQAIVAPASRRAFALGLAHAFGLDHGCIIDPQDADADSRLAAQETVLELGAFCKDQPQGAAVATALANHWLTTRAARRTALKLLRLSPSQADIPMDEFTRLAPAEYRQINAAVITAMPDHADETRRLWALFSAGDLIPGRHYRHTPNGLERLDYTQASAAIGVFPAFDPKAWYVITGGTGGIGCQLAQHLATCGAQRIVVTGSAPLPERDAWPALIADPQTPEPLRVKLTALSTLPERVIVSHWDLGDPQQLRVHCAALRAQAPIAAVIHLAGAVDTRPAALIDKTPEAMARILAPKWDGARHLASALSQDPQAKLLLCSSQAAAMPRLARGVMDYAIANAALNRLAIAAAAETGPDIGCLMLPNWADAGFGVSQSPDMADLHLHPVEGKAGLTLFDAALAGQGALTLGLCATTRFSIDPALTMAPRDAGVRSPAPTVTVATPAAKPEAVSGTQGATPVNRDALIAHLAEMFAPVIELDPAQWGRDDAFAALGIDSVLLTRLGHKLETLLGNPVAADILIAHDSLAALADWVISDHCERLDGGLFGATSPSEGPSPDGPMPVSSVPAGNADGQRAPAPVVVMHPRANRPPPEQGSARERGASDHAVAIVGIGAVLPGAEDADAFWRNLLAGRDLVREVPAERWSIERFFAQKDDRGTPSKWGAFVDGLEYFDATDFGLPASAGEATDPLVRLALWAARGAICDAGLRTEDLRGARAGVYMGSRVANWSERLPHYHRDTVLGTAQNFVAAHIAHWLDLRGPAIVVDSACSSSLLSLHLACQGLLADDCDIALAGGSECLLDERPYQLLGRTGAMSPTGRCRTFDAAADGFVPGEGGAVLVLKRLSNALIDGDRIYAVIEGSAVNNDGRTMGVTTPNPQAQRDVIRRALVRARISARDVDYVEAHGTGTALGDPMELKGLTEVFRESAGEGAEEITAQSCGVGSVKSAIGHLLSTAGAASAIKVALSLHHGVMTPTLHCREPNPRFAFETSPFFPVRGAQQYVSPVGRRHAGINAFGFGGTNVHLQMSDRHRSMAYAPAREALPVPARDGPYCWHPRPGDARVAPSAAPSRPAATSPAAESPRPEGAAPGGFNLVRTA